VNHGKIGCWQMLADRHALQLRENYLCALSSAGNPVHVSKSRQSSRFSHVLVLRKMNAFFEFGNCFVLLTHRKKRESKPFMSSGICAEIGIRPVCPPIFRVGKLFSIEIPSPIAPTAPVRTSETPGPWWIGQSDVVARIVNGY